jgi:trimethylguanosine synthase
MVNKSPDICPFGPDLQKYWDKRYTLFSKWDDGIQTDIEGLYSVIPEDVGLNQASHIEGTTVLDGFSGIGGSAIAFARAGKQVISADIDAKRLEMAKHNADIYGVSSGIEFMLGDFLEVATKVIADTVNLDPPWGGPAYKELRRFLLKHFSPDGNKLLNLSLEHFNEVVIRVPTIFDFTELEQFHVPYQVFDDVSNDRVVSKTVILRKSNASL